MVRRTKGVDIRTSGSGNVGAMNAFEVTNSKRIGIMVLLGDLLKGTIAVVVGFLIFGSSNQTAIGIISVAVVLGHNYPVWLRFKGGRGLSTAAGVMLVMNWVFVALWCALWGILYKLMKDIHRANIIASFASPLILFLLPRNILDVTLPRFVLPETALYVSFSICALILLRHTEQLRLMFSSFHQSSK